MTEEEIQRHVDVIHQERSSGLMWEAADALAAEIQRLNAKLERLKRVILRPELVDEEA